MQVVLLERVEKLGQMGDVVRVKDGFARNFLLPRKKAMRATKANIEHFEGQRVHLEARNLELKAEAEQVHGKVNGQSFIVLRSAGETGILYGSVSTRDVAAAMTDGGFSTARNQVVLDKPIKAMGLHNVRVVLHPEVFATITINVARTEDEAKRQAAGEDLSQRHDEEDEVSHEATEFFESEELAPDDEEEISVETAGNQEEDQDQA
ncbi:MAG: 50S ribosomal protein L9 [Alphaproteobacteria bacterium HGW-Alphaproteobacteria-12]|nr:MAG: 50S ribosomal protein L9 [Alphaproteobacteria bacterium HGW-Alphaproteobacteria-12]